MLPYELMCFNLLVTCRNSIQQDMVYLRMMNNKDDAYKQKFMAFAIRMVKLKNYLNDQKHEYNIADQIQRSGTAIGANHL